MSGQETKKRGPYKQYYYDRSKNIPKSTVWSRQHQSATANGKSHNNGI